MHVANLSCYQRAVYYSGKMMFNSLQSAISELNNDKTHFRATLQSYLVLHLFYSTDEFLAYSRKTK
jgi:hypothetical protein